ncbi:MAG: CDP-diacylglycerol--serine O-phosphatidyltransferase [Bacillota bacterium]|nr:CDP-diacylglycerol--serine O-phosphatidyltransferase [Bacillota bacterium]
MKSIKGTLPNILTLINLSLGVTAILLAMNDRSRVNWLIPASLLIMVAALTDRFDGKVARMLDVSSELGKELDSLSDLISFGVAPVIIAWKISLSGHFGVFGYLIALVFPIAGAFRLARYNVSTFNNVFSGMPITVAGAFLTIDNLYNCFAVLKERRLGLLESIITVVLILGLSALMVSKIRIKKI